VIPSSDDDPEVIRRQMEVQRASLAEKVEALEQKMVQTVQSTLETVQTAKDAVTETVETVKDTVQSSVESVKDTFTSSVESVKDSVHSSVESVKDTLNVEHQVEQHPWAMFGGSVVLGFLGGLLINKLTEPNRRFPDHPQSLYTGAESWSRPQPSASSYAPSSSRFTGSTEAPAQQPAASSTPVQPEHPWLAELSQTFAPEIQKVKGLAIGALVGAVRDLVAQSVPEQFRPQLNEVMDNMTTKLGGEPVQPQFLDQLIPGRHGEHHNGHQRAATEGMHS